MKKAEYDRRCSLLSSSSNLSFVLMILLINVWFAMMNICYGEKEKDVKNQSFSTI